MWREKKIITVSSVDKVLGLVEEEKFNCPSCHAILVQRKGKKGKFWGCSSYPDCKTTLPNKGNKPDFMARAGGVKGSKQQVLDKACPDCGKPLVKRKGKRGAFAGCSSFPVCKHTEPLSLEID